MKNILFLCTGNSARSIMAEGYMNHASSAEIDPHMTAEDIERRLKEAAPKRWRAFSAGSKPTGRVNPLAIETLAAHGVSLGSWMPHPGARQGSPPDPERTESGIEYSFYSKSWDEFAAEGAPLMDAVVTVCDNAAGEVCPIWPSQGGKAPQKLHWSFPDPAAVQGNDAQKRAAFKAVFADIRTHIDAFLAQSA